MRAFVFIPMGLAVLSVLYPAVFTKTASAPAQSARAVPVSAPVATNAFSKQYPLCQQYVDRVGYHAKRVGISPNLLMGLIIYESIGCQSSVISYAGAVGLGQVMPSDNTKMPKYNLKGRPTTAQLKDPEINITWSANILAAALKAYPTKALGLARYNGSAGTAAGVAYANRVIEMEARVASLGAYK